MEHTDMITYAKWPRIYGVAFVVVVGVVGLGLCAGAVVLVQHFI